ncbi:hypothetical protein [Streptomyces halobius]|uniref:Uncharacterized protein n=1 Tax=Streptomyces halobius TaxID=2879846 RepID=A0ABY4M5U2_9ACTN|nr:hypothetical protein [Streptomyces halobius]UQA92842.1 hypothetical protein K9S39_14270 [Streptomyces halobius]
MALNATHHEIRRRPGLGTGELRGILRRMSGVRSGARPPAVAALHLWQLRDAVCVNFYRLASVACPPDGGRLRYLPRATRRRLYALVARVPRDRACALTRLARLSKAVGTSNPSQP